MNRVINIQCLENTTLYKELVARNNKDTIAIIANLVEVCDEASNRAKLCPVFFTEYTLHDQTHFVRVTELMAYILGDTLKKLNDIEIILLILSAFYHDQGMIIDNSDYSLLEKDENFILFKENWLLSHPNYIEIANQLNSNYISDDERKILFQKIAQLDSAILTDYLRDTHGEKAYNYINKTFLQDKRISVFGISLANYLAEICLSHTKSIDWILSNKKLLLDENIGTLSVNTIFLSFILRLADILDFDSDRTPDVLFNSIHFTNEISINEWQKHRNVKGWKISDKKIQFTMYFDHPVYEKTARAFLDWIDQELDTIHKEIRNFPAEFIDYRIHVPNKIDRSRIGAKNNSYLFHDLEFSLSRNEVVKLLMTDNLYKNTSLFLRELLQNSLDALRLRKAIFRTSDINWEDGKIEFKHYLDEHNQEIVECHDNGCGMDETIIANFLGKIGRSYYKSPEFEQLRLKLKEGNADFEPCSQFGIGFMSLFMVGDRIIIKTRRDYGVGKAYGKPLILEINGLGGLMVIREGDKDQNIGTTIKVYTREKPLLYDEWRDKIRLILTLKGYAIATEFPIYASCKIKEIKQDFVIPIEIDRKKTFLEKINIENIKTIEIDLNEVNKDLRGFLRQSFLIDEEGNLCLENDEAKWACLLEESKVWKDEKVKYEKAILSKKNNTSIKYDSNHGLERGHSICIDGILVCGYPGRSEYSKYEMFGLGHISPQVHSEHPFTIDIRGKIKPEITPAREPANRHSMLRPGWSRIHDLIAKGSGKLWKKILDSTGNEKFIDIFWNLIFIYGDTHNYSILNIPSKSLLKSLYLPVLGNKWLKLSSIQSFYNDDALFVTDYQNNKYELSFSEKIQQWARCSINQINLQDLLIRILKAVSELHFNIENEPTYYIRRYVGEFEVSSDYSFYWGRAIPFIGIDQSVISSANHPYISNLLNPLVDIVLNSNTKQNSDIRDFASSFINRINQYIKDCLEEGNEISIDDRTDIFRYEAALYCSINWSKYSPNLKPPYRIYVNGDTTIEITDTMLKDWYNS